MSDTCDGCGEPLTDGRCTNPECLHFVPLEEARSTATGTRFEDDDLERIYRRWSAWKRNPDQVEFVTVFGFPTAGKTWLTARLLEKLPERGWDRTIDPILGSANLYDYITAYRSIGQTRNLLVHAVVPQGSGDEKHIELVDIPGEFVRRLVEEPRAAPPLSLIAALAMSDRVIIAVPSDVCVLGSLVAAGIQDNPKGRDRQSIVEEIERRDDLDLDRRRAELAERIAELRKGDALEGEEYSAAWKEYEDVSVQLVEKIVLYEHARLLQFADRMNDVFGQVAHVLDRFGRDGLFDEKTDPDTWLRDFDPLDALKLPPISSTSFAALTKADRVVPLLTDALGGLPQCEEWRDLPERKVFYDRLCEAGWNDTLGARVGDPRLVVSLLNPKLLNRFDRWLPRMQYEWASADWESGDWAIEMDMSHPDAGVDRLCDWLLGDQSIPKAPWAIHDQLARIRAGIEGRDRQGRPRR
ncbi:hypothetical protein [Qipengyuania sp. JC766]|uniref:hypothetical protein n=1 Tax=Qipengyuania sp. JC766 TaxID=3232139 RepID=UPI003459CCAB